VLGTLWLAAGWPIWSALLALLAPWAGFWLATDRYAGLGHALTDQYLVVRSGSLQGHRDALQRTGIIGWNIRQTFFQRRAGLVTLSATTAAGRQAYHAVDLPEDVAIALADAAVPGLVSQFVELGVRTP
jgi:putative membrane protein